MSVELVESFSQMVREKGIDKDHLAVIIEEIFGILVKKRFGENARYNVVFNTDKGEIEIFLSREIVDAVTDDLSQISIDEVNDRGNEDELEVGDDYVEKLKLAIFGRRLITFAKQSLNQRIHELEKEIIFKEYKQIEGEIVIGDVYQINKTNILVNHNKNQLVLPKEEQIPSEKPKKGDTLRAIVKEVGKGNKGPEIIISRASNEFLKKLFEIEVPEIYDGIIDIKGIARKPGERAKLAVSSQDKRIDPVGACIGMKGVRVTAIVRELNNENIDVVHYSDDPKAYVQRALLPGKIKKIEINAQEHKAIVFADADQAAQIVGRGGVNITLAAQLTGYEIEFIREEKTVDEYEEDIELIDLRAELGEDLYNTLINNRFDSALEVLRAGKEKLSAIAELSEEDVEKILTLIQSELEEE
jgi:N utilization substance protein A